jgi:hypothetical protein
MGWPPGQGINPNDPNGPQLPPPGQKWTEQIAKTVLTNQITHWQSQTRNFAANLMSVLVNKQGGANTLYTGTDPDKDEIYAHSKDAIGWVVLNDRITRGGYDSWVASGRPLLKQWNVSVSQKYIYFYPDDQSLPIQALIDGYALIKGAPPRDWWNTDNNLFYSFGGVRITISGTATIEADVYAGGKKKYYIHLVTRDVSFYDGYGFDDNALTRAIATTVESYGAAVFLQNVIQDGYKKFLIAITWGARCTTSRFRSHKE